jgi:hypothetical protein
MLLLLGSFSYLLLFALSFVLNSIKKNFVRKLGLGLKFYGAPGHYNHPDWNAIPTRV